LSLSWLLELHVGNALELLVPDPEKISISFEILDLKPLHLLLVHQAHILDVAKGRE